MLDCQTFILVRFHCSPMKFAVMECASQHFLQYTNPVDILACVSATN